MPVSSTSFLGKRFEERPSWNRSGGLSRRHAVREVAAWLGHLCDSSIFFDFPFSQEGWAEKIHPVVVEQPTQFINR